MFSLLITVLWNTSWSLKSDIKAISADLCHYKVLTDSGFLGH